MGVLLNLSVSVYFLSLFQHVEITFTINGKEKSIAGYPAFPGYAPDHTGKIRKICPGYGAYTSELPEKPVFCQLLHHLCSQILISDSINLNEIIQPVDELESARNPLSLISAA